MGGSRTASPDDTFSCFMRTLAQVEYRVENTDRDSGFIMAVRENTGIFSGEYVNEATVMIIPATEGQGSDVSVTMRRAQVTPAGGRSSAGVTMTGDSRDDLELLSGACIS